nr:hypothetical protein [Tanacetum cinerariifolium]
MKASKRTSRFQHQTGGLSEGAGLRLENDKEEDDARIDIEKTDYKRTDTDDEDMVMGKAEKTVEQKADEEHEANKEQKGDEHAKDEQVVVPVSTT